MVMVCRSSLGLPPQPAKAGNGHRSACASTVGGIAFDGNKITGFAEKHAGGYGWINGGFMVMEPNVLDYLRGDKDSLEISLLERLGCDDQLAAYKHPRFWQCMDTMRDKQALEQLWGSEAPPWKRW
jgi:glucose-1-phosphate cytidylyltransferase